MMGSTLPTLGQTAVVEAEGGKKTTLVEEAEADIDTVAVEGLEGAGFSPEG